MQITCRSCSAVVPADHIDLPTATAKCAACFSVFSFRSSIDAPPPMLERAHVGLPERFALETGDPLRISWAWRNEGAIFMVFFLVFWFGFLLFWNVMAFATGAWFMSVFSLLHIGIGVFIGVRTLRALFNTTELTCDRSALRIKIGPIPAPGNLELPSSSLEQLFCVAKEHRGKHGRRWHTYTVMAKTKDGREQKLVDGLEHDRAALFIEQQIEKKLGIRDVAMPGELKRSQ